MKLVQASVDFSIVLNSLAAANPLRTLIILRDAINPIEYRRDRQVEMQQRGERDERNSKESQASPGEKPKGD